MTDVQRLSSEVEKEYIDHLWARLESLSQSKIYDEAVKLTELKRKLNQQKERNKTIEKKLSDLKKESNELNRLKNILLENNDRFLESWDTSDPLFGAFSANEFINFDFLEALDETFNDPDNSKFIDEAAQEVFTIEDWINSLPSQPQRIRQPPPNRKGKLLKRLGTLSKDDLNPFHIQRQELLDEVKLKFLDAFYPNEMIKRRTGKDKLSKISDPMVYLFDYMRYRIEKSLPWAICGQYIGFVACPANYRTLIFNTQDGYFNAHHLTGVFSDKTVENFLRTLEGKMLIKSFPERYTHQGKGIPGAYRLHDHIAKTFAESFIWTGLPGISFDSFKGIYLHPELLESFASYLGQQTLDWVQPNLRYLRSNPARYINGDSWYIAAAGTVPPNYQIRIKPLQKHLILWLRDLEDPYDVHLSFGDKWYLRKVLRQPGVRLIVEFFGILDDDFSKVEEILNTKAKSKPYKTWHFKDFVDVKTAVTEIYLNIDRAYYGYDSLKDYSIKLQEDILFVREKPYTFDDRCILNPEVIESYQTSKLSNDRLYGNASDYIVKGDEEFELDDARKEFFDDYTDPIKYNFEPVKVVSIGEGEVVCKEVEAEGYFADIDWRDLATKEAKTPTPHEVLDAQRTESDPLRLETLMKRSSSKRVSSTGAVASEFGDPLLFRERRKMLLRAAIVTYLLKEYTRKEEELKAEMNNPELSSDMRIKKYEEYSQVFSKDHKKKFVDKIVKAFYNLEEIDLLQKKNIPVEYSLINVVELDEMFQEIE